MNYNFNGSEDFVRAFDYAAGAGFGGALAMFGFTMSIAFVMGLARYIMNALGILFMAKKVGIRNGWLGFIPIADLYLLGKIADVSAPKKNNAKRLLISQIVFVILSVVMIVSVLIIGVSAAIAAGTSEIGALTGAMIPFVLVAVLFSVSAVFVAVYYYIACYRVCEDFGGKYSILWFLGILLGGLLSSGSLIPPILLLVLSSKTPKSAMGAIPDEPIEAEFTE